MVILNEITSRNSGILKNYLHKYYLQRRIHWVAFSATHSTWWIWKLYCTSSKALTSGAGRLMRPLPVDNFADWREDFQEIQNLSTNTLISWRNAKRCIT
jgi:hypothetical protein